MKPDAWTEFRMLMAEKLMLLALRISPSDHPASLALAKCLDAYAAEALRTPR